jgi:hypothetical protein
VLLHLFRGAGSKGLAGMSPREERSIPWWPASDGLVGRFAIIRPLLAEPRSAIDAYVSEIGISPIQDESNEATDFDRNWIRHNVLPAILQRWPAAIASIDRMAAIVRTEFELLDIATEEFVIEEIDRDRTLCTDELLRLPFPLAQRVIRHWLSELGVSDVNHDVVARCYELARSGRESREIEAGNGVSIVVAGGCLTSLDELIESTARRRPMLGASGRTLWEISTDTGDGEPDGVVWAPVDRSVELRTLRRGDRWLGTERSVFEDLRSAGIHPLLRTQVLALVADGGVLLIPAIYPTIRARTADGPVKKVEVRWRRLEGRGQRSARIRGSSAF